MDLARIDLKIRKILLPYFIIIFITTFIISILHIFYHNYWAIGDWLINYQGGFVRRGLIGEIIFIFSKNFNISPGFIVLFLITFFYFSFFYLSYKLLKLEKNLLPLSLLIFSPFLFTFQINDWYGGYRKEIIFFSLMAYMVWLAKTKRENFETIFYMVITIFLPLMILSYEVIAIFSPYLFAIYFISTQKNITRKIIISLIPSLLSLLLIIKYKGNEQIVTSIYLSLKKLKYIIPIHGGAIATLKYNIKDGYEWVINTISRENYTFYLIILFLVAIAFFPIRYRILSLTKNKNVLFSISISLLFSLGLSIIALDWGRWIYIHAVTLFLLSMLAKESDKNRDIRQLKKINLIYYFAFILIYSSFWHIIHYGNPAKGFYSNLENFCWPYIYFYFQILH